MFNDCSKVVESYLLYQNPFYAFSLPISLIIAIIVYGICVSMKCTSNSYMLQIIIPIVTMIIVNIIIEFVARTMLNKNEINNLTKRCVQYLAKNEHFENSEDSNESVNKNSKVKLMQKLSMPSSSSVESISVNNNLYEVINDDSKPYTLPFNGVNSANNCHIS
jgi:hypothetical protein